MKSFLALLLVISNSANAEEESIFDESAYIVFINQYSAENTNSKLGPDGKTLTVKRDGGEIFIQGGGCAHLGMTIESSMQHNYTEQQFLQTTLDLSREFGDWLLNTKALEDSIADARYQIIDASYYIEVDAMTVFSASHDGQGNINIDMYIN